MSTERVFSYAKLNLTLDITGVKEGYHLLDSFVCSIDLADEIVVRPRKDKLVSVIMHGMDSESIPMEDNIAFKAGEAFVKRYDTQGADITVFKNIPMGAGVGGSSADCSGVLRGMAKAFNIDDETGLKEIADSLGSDTGYMLHGGFARMTGRGNEVWRLSGGVKLYFLLLVPRTPVSTGACYKKYDESPDPRRTDTEACISAFLNRDVTAMGKSFYNALTAPAVKLNLEVEKALAEAEAFSPLGFGMTGSGSGVFALFPTKELAEWAKSRYRGKARAYVVESVIPDEKEKKRVWRNPFVLQKEELNNTH